MKRNWQHTSFCMGQCVSSCGSKRTLDSVPTTPDTDNYPGIIPSAKITHRKNSSSNVNLTTIEDQEVLAFKPKQKSSAAAKFVTAFSQRRIVTRRINPEGESPVHIDKNSASPVLSFKLTTSQTSDSVTYHHGDMKDSTVKNYFRETISSAKKTSAKSVTFSEASPAATTARKKSFFSFHKSISNKTPNENEPHLDSSPSLSLSKVILRKKTKSGTGNTLPTIVRPLKEKQVCRVTFSPKRGSTVVKLEQTESPISTCKSASLNLNTNGDEVEDSNSPSRTSITTSNQAMGNASSSSQGLVVEAVKTIKPIVKPNSTNRSRCPFVDLNENNTKSSCTLSFKKSGESPRLIRKDSKSRPLIPVNKNESGSNTRNSKSIKEENRLLRLKFFLEDTSESPTSPLEIFNTDKNSSPGTASKMSRQLSNKSSIPLPRSAVNKHGSSSSIPKLYSIPSNENEVMQKSTVGSNNSRIKSNQKVEPEQPTNMGSGKWVPAADFFEQPLHNNQDTHQSSTSPSSSLVSKSVRRSSEPPRWIAPGSSISSKGIRDVKRPDIITERRGTIGFQRKFTVAPSIGNVSKITKPGFISDKNPGVAKINPTKVGIRKPEETKPFYTIGLYQNRPKPVEPLKPFGVHQTGFHGVSTGIVRQRTQQYQSKVADPPHVPKLHSNVKDAVLEKKGDEKVFTQHTSPSKPGVMRSATYTIRKHGLLDEEKALSVENREQTGKAVVKAKSDVDPRYLTWTVRKPGKLTATSYTKLSDNTRRGIEQKEVQKDESCDTEERFSSTSGYPLQHNPSGTSTSSMGTNEDCIGDHVVISDSEYLIDDEISDQPDLTLTFKDSSLKLSTSSSGESLLSDIMLDHLDLNQERILGELTSDSAISDISNHKHVSKGSSDQLFKYSEKSKSNSFEQTCGKGLEKSNSPNETASPSSVRTVRHLKSPRRTSKPISVANKTIGQSYVEINTSRSSSSTVKSTPTSTTSTTGIKYRTTPDKKQTPPKLSQEKHHSFQSFASPSPSANRIRSTTKEKIVELTVENVDKLHKQYELVDSHLNVTEDSKSLPVPFTEELLEEFQGVKTELEKLRLQLETQERREREKDELILRLTNEVERLKSGKNLNKCKERNRNVSSPRLDVGSDDTSVDKERYINSLNYENAAVQTENNNLFNRTVSYPEEDDKYGELVSFRIGRSSSLKKKL